jgi:hypothetical protein
VCSTAVWGKVGGSGGNWSLHHGSSKSVMSLNKVVRLVDGRGVGTILGTAGQQIAVRECLLSFGAECFVF